MGLEVGLQSYRLDGYRSEGGAAGLGRAIRRSTETTGQRAIRDYRSEGGWGYKLEGLQVWAGLQVRLIEGGTTGQI